MLFIKYNIHIYNKKYINLYENPQSNYQGYSLFFIRKKIIILLSIIIICLLIYYL